MTNALAIVLLLGTVMLAGCGAVRGDDDADARTIIQLLDARPGDVLADVGAGSELSVGVRVARHLGPAGKLYATELGEKMTQSIADAARQAKLDNVVAIEAHSNQTNLPPGCCDGIYMRNVYHHFGDTKAMNASLFASLKPGGRLVVMDFEPRTMIFDSSDGRGNERGHGVQLPDVVAELKQAGFEQISSKPHEDADAFVVVMRKPGSR